MPFKLMSVAGALLLGLAGAQANAQSTPVRQCDETLKAAFASDPLTKVVLVKYVPKGSNLSELFPDTRGIMKTGGSFGQAPTNLIVANNLCLVKLIVGPGNPGPALAPSTSPGIGMEIWLPDAVRWNGRLHMMGGGGWAGGDHTKPTAISTNSNPYPMPWDVAGEEGAISASTDTGHKGGGGAFAMNPDGTINTALWVDYSHRGIHETAVKAKALAIAYYGSPPKYSYFQAMSTGGRQALKAAQTHPEDFDGIVSGVPALYLTNVPLGMLWPQIVVQRDLGGKNFTDGQLNAVTRAAIASCDVAGGQHLGYVLDPYSCRYDPTTDPDILCASAAGKNSTSDCLTLVQANAMNKIWYGQTSDGSAPSPAIDIGLSATLHGTHRWYGYLRGTSLATGAARNGGGGPEVVALALQNPKYAGPTFQNATGNGEDLWKSLSYQEYSDVFDKAIALQDKFARVNASDPDLSRFRDRGGRLIMYMGLADTQIMPEGPTSYFRQVATKLGGTPAVQRFFRFYQIPGFSHDHRSQYSVNPGAAFPALTDQEWYKAITDWVEKGIAPSEMIASSVVSPVNPKLQTGKLCLYPQKSTYVSGSPYEADSYKCR